MLLVRSTGFPGQVCFHPSLLLCESRRNAIKRKKSKNDQATRAAAAVEVEAVPSADASVEPTVRVVIPDGGGGSVVQDAGQNNNNNNSSDTETNQRGDEDEKEDDAWTTEAGGSRNRRVKYERPPDASAADREGLSFLMTDLGNALGTILIIFVFV